MTKVYIHCEDFVDAFVGPFDSKEAANDHINNVIIPRGDSSTNRVITEEEYKEESPGWITCTPEEDMEFDPNA